MTKNMTSTLSWDARFMKIALMTRDWVKGPDLGVGACIVSPDKSLISIGYSGFPRGVEDSDERLLSTEYKDLVLVHAELNALLNAKQNTFRWTLYSTKCLCSHCAAAAIQAGILRVVCPAPDPSSKRWHANQIHAMQLLQEAGKTVKHIDPEDLEI